MKNALNIHQQTNPINYAEILFAYNNGNFLQAFVVSYGQGKIYLSEIIYNPADSIRTDGFSLFGMNYWRFDESIFVPNSMSKYNTSTGVFCKMIQKNNLVINEILEQNYTAPYGKMPKDTFRYVFDKPNSSKGVFVRKLLIKEKYTRIDTFYLTLIDSFDYKNSKQIKKVFGKQNSLNQKLLRIYVYKSVDSSGSIMMHYWVERM